MKNFSDPIEAGSFTTVLASNRTLSNPLHIGSLKSNFGQVADTTTVSIVSHLTCTDTSKARAAFSV